jgi:hypothetical protein
VVEVVFEMMLGCVDVGSVVVDETGVSKFGVGGCVGVCIAVLFKWMNDDNVLGGSTLSGW